MKFLAILTLLILSIVAVQGSSVAELRKLRAAARRELGNQYRFGGDNGRDHGMGQYNSTGTATTTTTTTTDEALSTSDGRKAAKIAIKVGAVAFFAALFGLGIFLCRRRRSNKQVAVPPTKEVDVEEMTAASDVSPSDQE